VVCFTSDHEASFKDLSVERVRTVIDTWAHRTRELGALPEVEQVFCFENRGKEIGVTLPHPHGQIYAYPYLPSRSAQLLDAATRHHEQTGRLLGADILAAERADGSRVVLSGTHWTAYVPFAARWPVEVHLAPHRDVPDLDALDDAERDELAVMYRDLLHRLERVFGEPMELPYIAGWHQAPIHTGRDLTRLHLQLFSLRRAPGKLKFLAGSESGMAAWINDVAPEQIAERLRAAGS
jgi:UDPglucose--hexose-1-phosphate uridylyltransferase